jgi:hypothetical protein
VSDRAYLSGHRNPRRLVSRGVAWYFAILFVLTCIAFTPDAITAGLLLFILPGLVLAASPTLLAYSIGLLPAYLINRHLGKRLLALGVAALGVAATAVLPHYVDRYRLGRLVASDISDRSIPFRPRSFVLPYRDQDIYWTTWRGQALRQPPPPCADLCQQLLFKGNIDQVFVFGDSTQDPVTHGSIVFMGHKAYLLPEGSRRTFRAIDLPHDSSVQEVSLERALHPVEKWRRFRLQRQETCPATLSIINFAPGERCLIEEIANSADADVVVSISEPPPAPNNYRPTNRCQHLVYRGIQDGPTTVTIAERRSGKLVPVEIKTTLVAQYAAIPFYFNVRPAGGDGIPHLCLGVASEPFPRSFADPFEMIARRYGLPIARTPGSDRPTRSH